MKQVKLYNLIFPIWFLLFFPPVIFITLIGNLIIDSLVIIACFFMFKLGNTQNNLKTFYKKNILSVLGFGFLADIIGALLLFILVICEVVELPYELSSAISYDPFSHPLAVIIILFAMLISTIFIFIFNYKFTFSKEIEDQKLRLKVSISIALLTIPWTFLLPAKWFYSGF
ncbi:hypothetical protein [Tepidibacter hydrothermalis]|uniref:Uncharacterized protein n=1 Tax=Tepidibacter hydrothermalis TaxID=3036126 RepID=A0ABY8EFD7_9FIRM|nr:hypothetical protein [Tepidibacter hydrothermalis]WFD09448.1 hypothetical protein P4S50_13765 [Tepidibacter hydrothermalis]